MLITHHVSMSKCRKFTGEYEGFTTKYLNLLF